MRARQGIDRLPTLGMAALAAVMAACLPRGAPPSGRQVVADRQSTLEAIVPPNGDGVLRILILRPGPAPSTSDLYLVSVDATGGPPSEQLLLSNVNPQDDFGCLNMIAPCSMIFPDGSLWVYKGSTASGLWRIDPFSGAELELPYLPQISASGDRFFVSNATSGTLYEADGSTIAIDLAPASTNLLSSIPNYPAFFGEDFYYLTPEGALMHLPPSGAAEQLATGIAGFQGTGTPDGVLLLLIRSTSDPNVQAYSYRDPLTGAETASPFTDPALDVSPDGNWLVDTGGVSAGVAMTTTLTFFNYRTGAKQAVEIDAQTSFGIVPQWRPGTTDVWFTTGLGASPTVWIVTAGGTVTSVPGAAFGGFSADGAHWFSTPNPDTTKLVVQVGTADDPTGPLFDLGPQGTSVYSYWPLADGRLLTAAYTDSQSRSDVFAVDPDTGNSVQLAERGVVAAVGQTRFVGMFHYESERGDLTTVEVENGRQTILAPEFAVTAFVEPQGADLVAPGTRVVYEFQARSDSPYDGIWVVNSP